MKDLDDKLSDDDKNDLNDALEKLKKANESSVIEDIKSEMENLNSVWSSKAFQCMMHRTLIHKSLFTRG